MNLLQSLVRSKPASRSMWPLDTMTMGGVTYPLGMPQTTLGFKEEEIAPTYSSVAAQAYEANPVVFGCVELRRRVFSQASLQWQQVRGGTPGKFFGTPALSLFEKPWPNATGSDLLGRMLQDADLAGNAFAVRRGPRIHVLRPDWVTIVAASTEAPEQGMAAIDAEVIGYMYHPGGKYANADPVVLLPEEMAHFAPTPDPLAKFRGWSWINVAIREIMGDNAATTHKLKYFEQGATPNMVISLDPAITPEKFKAWVELFDQGHEGVANAYKTLYLGGGADAKPVGSDMKQLDFKVTQGAGETRIAVAAGVPPILVGLSEGLASGTYSNYGMARRSFTDTTLWDLWGNLAGSLESILPPPPNARLWVDSRRIPFLQEDEADRANIQQLDASAISTLVTAGYAPESVVDAVTSGDLNRLVHSGLYSVQLQKPGEDQGDDIEDARAKLIASGVKRPTQAQLAAELGVSERTIRRWSA